MNNKIINIVAICSIVILATACSSMTNLKNKLADMQMQKMQLNDGSTVYIDNNVPPTPAWNCQELGHPTKYNWSLMQTEGQFNLKGGARGLIMKKAIDDAAQQGIKPNYINIQLPNQYSMSTGNARMQSSMLFNPQANAIVTFYQCERINPEHQLGRQKGVDFGVYSGSAPTVPMGMMH